MNAAVSARRVHRPSGPPRSTARALAVRQAGAADAAAIHALIADHLEEGHLLPLASLHG
jgi:hypothetical protein